MQVSENKLDPLFDFALGRPFGDDDQKGKTEVVPSS